MWPFGLEARAQEFPTKEIAVFCFSTMSPQMASETIHFALIVKSTTHHIIASGAKDVGEGNEE